MQTTESLERPATCLSCTACNGTLRCQDDRLACTACSATFPVIDGRIIVFSQARISSEVLEKTMYGPEYEELISQIPRFAGTGNPGTVALDYGCGSSPEVFKLASEDAMGLVFGLDYDLEPLKILARAATEQGYDNVFLIQYDRENLPFADGVLDLVTSHQALEHVPDPSGVILAISRAMKPGATFRVDFPNGSSVGELLRELFHRLNRTHNPHVSRISLRRASDMFRAAGLSVERYESIYALRGPLVYFIEGFVLRFLFRRHKIYTVRSCYRNSAWFRGIGTIDAIICRLFPQLGQAYIFTLRKP